MQIRPCVTTLPLEHRGRKEDEIKWKHRAVSVQSQQPQVGDKSHFESGVTLFHICPAFHWTKVGLTNSISVGNLWWGKSGRGLVGEDLSMCIAEGRHEAVSEIGK